MYFTFCFTNELPSSLELQFLQCFLLGCLMYTSLILFKSLNKSSFDLIFAPEHDYSEKRIPNNVTTFQGSLAKPSFAQPHENQAIIAIGGTSKHYKFNANTMINQLHYILSTHPKYEFQIYNSRRTPEAANQKILNELN